MAASGTTAANRETYSALNGLRYLAAMAVVCFHYAHKIEDFDLVPPLLRKLVDDGPAAVGFFFILSGFLLATRHLSRSGSRTETPGTFYWARFIRLYPAYLVGFFLFLPFAVEKYLRHSQSGDAEVGVFSAAALLYLLMLQAWTPLAQSWNGPSWSLSVEAFMYFLFPWVVVRLTRMTWPTTALFASLAWLLPSALTILFIRHDVSEHTWKTFVGNNPLLWTPLFLIGICLAKCLPAWKEIDDRKANLISTAAFAAVILIAVITPADWTELLINGAVAPVLALVVLSFTRMSGWLTRVIGGKTMSQMGQASYVIYIIQSPLWSYWQALTNHLRHFPIRVTVITPWQFIFFLPFITLVAMGVQKYIETPIHSFLVSWKKSHSSRAPLSTPARAEQLGA